MTARIESPPVEVTDEDIRRAWRQCRIVNMSYEAAMATPALALTLRRVAESYARRHQRLAAQQQRDLKRAQANDFFDK